MCVFRKPRIVETGLVVTTEYVSEKVFYDKSNVIKNETKFTL